MGWLVDVGEMKNKNVTYKKTKNGRCTMMQKKCVTTGTCCCRGDDEDWGRGPKIDYMTAAVIGEISKCHTTALVNVSRSMLLVTSLLGMHGCSSLPCLSLSFTSQMNDEGMMKYIVIYHPCFQVCLFHLTVLPKMFHTNSINMIHKYTHSIYVFSIHSRNMFILMFHPIPQIHISYMVPI